MINLLEKNLRFETYNFIKYQPSSFYHLRVFYFFKHQDKSFQNTQYSCDNDSFELFLNDFLNILKVKKKPTLGLNFFDAINALLTKVFFLPIFLNYKQFIQLCFAFFGFNNILNLYCLFICYSGWCKS